MAILKAPGDVYSWANLELRLMDPNETTGGAIPHDSGNAGGPIVHLQGIELSFSQDGAPIYGRGRAPIAMGRGNVSCEGSMTVLFDYWKLFIDYWLQNERKITSLANLPPLEINGTLGGETDTVDIDVFGIHLSADAFSVAQNDQSISKQVSFRCMDVHIGGLPWTGAVEAKGESSPS